jgi:putative aldouronate transport system substrate-binding protein
MRTTSRWATVILAIMLAMTLAAGCSQNGTAPTGTQGASQSVAPSSTPDSTEPAAATLLDPQKPLKLTGAILYSSLRPNTNDSDIWKYVKEKTGVEIEFTVMKDADQVSLMFASRDFPDVAFNIGAKAAQLSDAAAAGDLLPLDDLIKQYAPTWDAFMKENTLAYKTCLLPDGKLYTLPFIDFAPYDRDIRDQWFLNKAWLDELKLEAPKTTDDFKNVLQAFKDNAGKGSIPQNVIPYYYFFDAYVGGQMDIYGAFGLYVSNGDYLSVDNGKVVYQAVNPDIKEPLKYLRSLYAAGLTPPEIFTDDWSTYLSKISADPAMTGSYHAYTNRNLKAFTPIAPPQSPNGKKPVMRRQNYVPNPAYAFMMFKDNPNPQATIAFCEWCVEKENLMTVTRGVQGVVWDYTADGKFIDIFWEESPDKMAEHAKQLGLHNSFITIRDKNYYDNLYYNKFEAEEGTRPWAYKNIYQSSLAPEGLNYVGGTLSDEDNKQMDQLTTDLTNLRKTKFADWISGKGDIDAEWDAFVSQNEALNLQKWLEFKQKSYDLMK